MSTASAPQSASTPCSQEAVSSQSAPSLQSAPSTQAIRQKSDPAWDHCTLTIESGGKKVYRCIHCNKEFRGGGINRVKQHLAGKSGNALSCSKIDADSRYRMNENLKEIEARKKKGAQNWEDENPYGPSVMQFDGDNLEEMPTPQAGESRGNNNAPAQQNAKKRAVGAMDKFFAPRTTPGAQPSIKSVLAGKEVIHRVDLAIAEFWFENAIPMNVLNSFSYQKMIDAIAAIGPGYKGPNFHRMRSILLSDMKKNVQLLVDACRSAWVETGCTIMADGWQDQKNRQLINFLVYCPKGITFVKSVDASDFVKDASTLCNLFVDLVEFAGPKNVVHFVTDNAANYKAAGRLLNDKYPSIYWSPCAAHCLNLILGDIGKMELVQSLAKRASLITKFVYNHGFLLAWLRKREGWKEIIRPGPTRFATTFIALKSIYEHKHDLQALATSKTFVDSRYYRDSKARGFMDAVLDNKFWNDCGIIVKIVQPLIRLLRIVDGDDRPSIGYVYDGMFRAKKAIKHIFMNKKSMYKPYTKIIKQRWDKQLRQKIHAAAYILNPVFYYDKESRSRKPEVMAGFLDVLTAQIDTNQTEFLQETELYRERIGEFDREIAISTTKTMRPDMWWKTFGNSAPNVQAWAIKILSQTASSSGCERNWSVFERIHTKKRNRLEHQRLNDLVFVHYNLKLKNRAFKKKVYDPIDFESIEETDFWITEEEDSPSPDLDYNEIERLLYNEDSIPRIVQDKEEDVNQNAPNKGIEEDGLNLDAFPQEDVNNYSGHHETFGFGGEDHAWLEGPMDV